MQSYHDYASFCPAKHDVYSVLSTEGGLNVNIGHIVYEEIYIYTGTLQRAPQQKHRAPQLRAAMTVIYLWTRSVHQKRLAREVVCKSCIV